MTPEEEIDHDLKQSCKSLRYILNDASYPGQSEYAIGIENGGIAVYVTKNWLSAYKPDNWSGFSVVWYENVEFTKKS